MKTFEEYQVKTHETAIYPQEVAMEYLALGLVGEAGEVAEKVKKVLRGDYIAAEVKSSVAKELGDVLWYITQLANQLGYDLEQIAYMNINKLATRHVAGTLQGEGDDR